MGLCFNKQLEQLEGSGVEINNVRRYQVEVTTICKLRIAILFIYFGIILHIIAIELHEKPVIYCR